MSAPGPSRDSPAGFLGVMLALSFFAFWNFSGAGQPSYMVRQMAFAPPYVAQRSAWWAVSPPCSSIQVSQWEPNPWSWPTCHGGTRA